MELKINDITGVERELPLSSNAGLMSFFVLLLYLKEKKMCSAC